MFEHMVKVFFREIASGTSNVNSKSLAFPMAIGQDLSMAEGPGKATDSRGNFDVPSEVSIIPILGDI